MPEITQNDENIKPRVGNDNIRTESKTCVPEPESKPEPGRHSLYLLPCPYFPI